MKYLLILLFWTPVLLYGQFFNMRWLAHKNPHQVIKVFKQAGKQKRSLLFVIRTGTGGCIENVRLFFDGKCMVEEKYKYAAGKLISEEQLEFSLDSKLQHTYNYDASGRCLQKEVRRNQILDGREYWHYYKDSLVYERLEYDRDSVGYLLEKEVSTYDALNRVKERVNYMPGLYEIPAQNFYEYKKAGNDSIVHVRELKNGKTDEMTDSIFNVADQRLYKVISTHEGSTNVIELKQYDSLTYRIVEDMQNRKLTRRQLTCCTTGKLALIHQYVARNNIRRDFFYNKNNTLKKVVFRGEGIMETTFEITYRPYKYSVVNSAGSIPAPVTAPLKCECGSSLWPGYME